jgi:hypothetical protein
MPKLMVRIQALKAPVLESFLEVAASPTYPHAQKDIHAFKALTAAMGIKVSQEHCIALKRLCNFKKCSVRNLGAFTCNIKQFPCSCSSH